MTVRPPILGHAASVPDPCGTIGEVQGRSDDDRRAPAVAATVLEVAVVSKRFAGVLALDDVSLDLRAGRGARAGRARTAPASPPSSRSSPASTSRTRASCVYRGEPVRFARPLDAQPAGITTIYQEVNLVPLMSVARNLFLGREPTNRLGLIDFAADAPRGDRQPRALRHPRRRPPPAAGPGLGAQQMVALARAVSTRPGRHHGRAHLLARAARGRAPVRGHRSPAPRRRRGRLRQPPAGRALPALRRASPCCATAGSSTPADLASSTGSSWSRLMLGREIVRGRRARHHGFGADDTTPAASPVLRGDAA